MSRLSNHVESPRQLGSHFIIRCMDEAVLNTTTSKKCSANAETCPVSRQEGSNARSPSYTGRRLNKRTRCVASVSYRQSGGKVHQPSFAGDPSTAKGAANADRTNQ